MAWALAGVVLLFFGRRLFWVVLGAVGFVAGLVFAVQFLKGESPWLVVGLGVITGLIVAGLAIFVQKLAVSLAGFLVGGYGAVIVLGPYLLSRHMPGPEALGPEQGGWAMPAWLLFLVGGFLAAILARLLFEWALVAVSAVLGALLILEALPPLGAPATEVAAFFALAFLGAVVQLGSHRKKKE